MKKYYHALCDLLDARREKVWLKSLGDYDHRSIQYDLDMEHQAPTTSSVHSGGAFNALCVQYGPEVNNAPFYLRVTPNFH